MNPLDRLQPTRLVPDFRGLNFEAARALQRQAEVTPADPNPDAPPLSAYWWEHQQLVIATQDPEPGTEVYRYDSVKVTLSPPEALADAFIRRVPSPTLRAEAKPSDDTPESK